MNIRSICVYGSDRRLDYVAQTLKHYGYDVYRDLMSLEEASVVILPPPVGDREVADVLPYAKKVCIIYGGMVSDYFRYECRLHGIMVQDYLKWDRVTEGNAILTGKGIIKQAAGQGAVIEESSCLVTGYGFCGKALAGLLMESGAYVDVMVRKSSLAAELAYNGLGYVDMELRSKISLEKYSYIFNTVPAMIIDRAVIEKMSSNAMIFDIASSPGGTDFDYCRKKGIFAVNSLGIPGKEFPRRAGELIAEAVAADIRNQ